jgi:hypothetical protein
MANRKDYMATDTCHCLNTDRKKEQICWIMLRENKYNTSESDIVTKYDELIYNLCSVYV